MSDSDYSVAHLRAFANELPRISRLPLRTTTNMGVSIRAVLNRLQLPVDLDVRTIDCDDLLAQFASAEAGRLTTNSRQTYKSGFRRGLDMFLRLQADDSDWDAPTRPTTHGTSAPGVPLVGHMFPLRADITIRVALPTNLTAAEADRLTGFIKALVV